MSHILFRWSVYSLMWIAGCLFLVSLGYFLGSLHGQFPDRIVSPIDGIFSNIKDVNTDLVFIIEIIGAIIGAFLLDFSKNRLIKLRQEFREYKKSLSENYEFFKGIGDNLGKYDEEVKHE